MSHSSTGHYEITLDASAADGVSLIPVAQALGTRTYPRIASVQVVTPKLLYVETFWALSGELVDNEFTFIVTGR